MFAFAHRCALDLKCKVMELCARHKHLNYQTVFNAAMLRQMLELMPTSREAMLTVVHMTQHVYERFECGELLALFGDYAGRRALLVAAERRREAEKRELARQALEAKAYQPTKAFSGSVARFSSSFCGVPNYSFGLSVRQSVKSFFF